MAETWAVWPWLAFQTKKHGQNIYNAKVVALEDPSKLKNEIDAVLISSEASENEIYEQIKFLEKYEIKIYKLYNR